MKAFATKNLRDKKMTGSVAQVKKSGIKHCTMRIEKSVYEQHFIAYENPNAEC